MLFHCADECSVVLGLLTDTVTEVRARPTLADVGNYVVIRFTVTVNENLEL